MHNRWIAWSAAATLGLGLSTGAWAVVGLGLKSWGEPFISHGQVLQCPHEAGNGKYMDSFSNGQKRVRGYCSEGLAMGNWDQWYANGQKQWTCDLETGELNGYF